MVSCFVMLHIQNLRRYKRNRQLTHRIEKIELSCENMNENKMYDWNRL